MFGSSFSLKKNKNKQTSFYFIGNLCPKGLKRELQCYLAGKRVSEWQHVSSRGLLLFFLSHVKHKSMKPLWSDHVYGRFSINPAHAWAYPCTFTSSSCQKLRGFQKSPLAVNVLSIRSRWQFRSAVMHCMLNGWKWGTVWRHLIDRQIKCSGDWTRSDTSNTSSDHIRESLGTFYIFTRFYLAQKNLWGNCC